MCTSYKPIASVLVVSLFLANSTAIAATGETLEQSSSFARIEIEQTSPAAGVYGEWILMKPGNAKVEGRHERQLLENLNAGNYTILVDPLEGATAHVTVSINGEVVTENQYPQAAISVQGGDNVLIAIENIFTKVGIVSVQSNPPGLNFTLIGPNKFEEGGTTPADYQGMPVGLYTATFHKIENCIAPQPRSDRLKENSRITLSISVVCEGIDFPQAQEQQKTLQYVSAKIDGDTVTFTDVPIPAWYATHVHDALKTGIVSGYRDREGKPTGLFGPGDNVTIAALAKIAHKIAGIDETKTRTEPKNTRARGTWFSQYFASAEELGWLVFRDLRIDPNRYATRAEVVATILQALDVPRNWPKGKMFSDVRMDTLYSASIETATAHGLVTGSIGSDGTPTGEFRPTNPINRAEIAKIISLAIGLYK